MATPVKPIPEGYHAVTPSIVVRDAAKALDFYQRAFGATNIQRMPTPDGKKIMHADFTIGDSHIMMSDELPEMGPGPSSPESLGGTCCNLNIYTKDVDALWKQALAAGAKVAMPLADQFWGDRYGKVKDPFGHEWGLMTHIDNPTPEEMKKRMEAQFSQAAKK